MKTRNIILYFVALLTFCSCQDMFEPADENTRQLDAMVQETDYVYGLLMYGYNRLPYIRTTQTDVATDDAVTNVAGDTYRKMATGEWKSDNNPMSQWNECKDGIQYVNLFLKYVNQVNWAQSAKSKQIMFIDRLTGEALGLRAILYYHLPSRAACSAPLVFRRCPLRTGLVRTRIRPLGGKCPAEEGLQLPGGADAVGGEGGRVERGEVCGLELRAGAEALDVLHAAGEAVACAEVDEPRGV